MRCKHHKHVRDNREHRDGPGNAHDHALGRQPAQQLEAAAPEIADFAQ